MGFFGGIDKVKREGAGRVPWLSKDGVYLYEVDKFIVKASEHPDREGQPTYIVEGSITQVIRGSEDSHKAGESRSWIQNGELNRAGNLTQKGERALGRVKNFIAAVLGGVEDADIDEEVCEGVAEGGGEAIKGLKLVCNVITTVSKKTGKSFTNVTWDALAEDE
jgi:hypothetical protein